MLTSDNPSVETRTSWVVASIVLVVMAVAFGAPWIGMVALKNIAAEVNGERSVPAFAGALMWIGSGFGGIVMGRVAERFGIRLTVIFGSVMIAVGLAISTLGPSWPLYVGHGLFIGFIGIGGINAPFYVYVSHWFDRRRGSALALISSGSYLAARYGRRSLRAPSLLLVGARQCCILRCSNFFSSFPSQSLLLRPPPQYAASRDSAQLRAREKKSVLGWPPNLVFALQMGAIFTCCIPMSMPQAHLVALCSDLGISAAHGAAMVSVLLAAAFMSRQIWGVISDRIGGLYTMLAGSALQAFGMGAFLLTQDEVGLFTVAALFGLGFSGLVPANVLASRELFPAWRAYWRMPTLLLFSGSGWRAAAGSPEYFMIISAITRRPLPPDSASISVNFLIVGTLALRKRLTAFAAMV